MITTNNSPSPRPLPRPDSTTRPYWEAARQHWLVIQRCLDCDRSIHYPRAICPDCLSNHLVYEEVTGAGTIYSFTVTHRPPPAFADEAPYIVALVDLANGVRLVTRIVDAAPEDISIGANVLVDYMEVSSEVILPVFRLVGSAAQQG